LFGALGSLACEQDQWGTEASWQALKLVDLVLAAETGYPQGQGEGCASRRAPVRRCVPGGVPWHQAGSGDWRLKVACHQGQHAG